MKLGRMLAGAACAAIVCAATARAAITDPAVSDYRVESNRLFKSALYRDPDSRFLAQMAPNGASESNARWENGQSTNWFIEDQRLGYDAVVGGILYHNQAAIDGGFKMFDWGFSHMANDGAFTGTAGGKVTGMFHSTAFFVEAVAHTLLFIQQSPEADQYASEMRHYEPLVHRAARWMIGRDVFDKGVRHDEPMTHRLYLDAAALGETGLLSHDQRLIGAAEKLIGMALPRQTRSGYNPEKGGPDSSYHAVGLTFAQYWLMFFPDDSLASGVSSMLDRGLKWEEGRMSSDGSVSIAGNTRTGGQEKAYSGETKHVAYTMVFRAFAIRGLFTGDDRWIDDARKIAGHEHWPV